MMLRDDDEVGERDDRPIREFGKQDLAARRAIGLLEQFTYRRFVDDVVVAVFSFARSVGFEEAGLYRFSGFQREPGEDCL